MKIVRTYTDDWNKLEIDGEVYLEGHSIDINELIEVFCEFLDAEYEAIWEEPEPW